MLVVEEISLVSRLEQRWQRLMAATPILGYMAPYLLLNRIETTTTLQHNLDASI
jgi:hypothetical protein